MPRIRRIAASFAIVMIVYWAYALLVVRWIEPPANLNGTAAITQGDRDRAGQLPELQLKQLQGLFPPDAWELQNPMMLESDHAKLLLQLPEHYTRPDGGLEITRCTIVIPYEGPAENEEQRRRQSIILQAPEGATLHFESPIRELSFKAGRLTGGELHGKVTIHSDWKEPGPEDDLLIVGSNVILKGQTISSVEPVDFQWGPHSGRGQGMVIKLLAGQPKSGMAASGLNVSGIESFELSRVERLHLDLPTTSASGERPGSEPLDVNCRGPFRFDAVQHVATFRDQVDVMKPNPAGPADQLQCDLLSIFFAPRPQPKLDPAAKKGRKTDDAFDLVVQRIEARGNPVVARVPSLQDKGGIVNLHGPRLEYDLLADCTTLDGGQEVVIEQGPNEIHARSLRCQSSGQGHMAQVTAQGPGWFRGQAPDRPDQQLEVAWNEKLLIHPREQFQEIHLTGGAELRFPGVGKLQSPEIFFWLVETASAIPNGKPSLRPKWMLARDKVHIDSKRLSGDIWETLEVWFEQTATNLTKPSRGTSDNATAATNVNGPAAGYQSAQAATSPQTPAQAPPQFKVVGRKLRAQVSLDGQQAAVSNLNIEGDVLFEGNGTKFTGPNVNIDVDKNRLWIDGAGQMQLPASEFLRGQAPATADVLTIDWRNQMDFDGLTARFGDAVTATSTQHKELSAQTQELTTAVMEVSLQRPFRFSDAQPSEPPQVEKLQCSGGKVVLKNRSFNQTQNLTSFDQLQVSDLIVNHLSGAVNAGPGWLNSVHSRSADALNSVVASPANTVANAARPASKLFCLHVVFQKSITGNLGEFADSAKGQPLRLTFSDRVQTTYGPVDNWEAILTTSDPQRLGKDGIVARCNQLSIARMFTPIKRDPSIWFEAADNAKVEGADFTALGNRITYEQDKDMVILEGDGRNNAELWPGAVRVPIAARKMWYSRKTKQWNVDGAQSLEIGQFPHGNAK